MRDRVPAAGLTPFALKRVREYVASHLAGTIRLQQLAALAGLSPFHFSRAFKASTGLSPHAYVLHCRVSESKRLLGVLETRLDGRQWIMDDDYTIADISMLGWVRNLIGFYGAGDLVAFEQFKAVSGWLERGLARPAVQRGLDIPKRP